MQLYIHKKIPRDFLLLCCLSRNHNSIGTNSSVEKRAEFHSKVTLRSEHSIGVCSNIVVEQFPTGEVNKLQKTSMILERAASDYLRARSPLQKTRSCVWWGGLAWNRPLLTRKLPFKLTALFSTQPRNDRTKKIPKNGRSFRGQLASNFVTTFSLLLYTNFVFGFFLVVMSSRNLERFCRPLSNGLS